MRRSDLMKTPPVAGALMAALAILWMTPTVRAQIVALGPPAPVPNDEPRAATATPPAPNSDSPATTGTPPAQNNEPPAATRTPPPPTDAPPPAAPPAAPDPIERARKALYERKPLIKTDVFTLELEGQLQVKYLHDQGTAETNGTYYTRPISQGFDNSLPHASFEGTDSFTIRRARIAL